VDLQPGMARLIRVWYQAIPPREASGDNRDARSNDEPPPPRS
jgi:hypothetical protein